MQRPGAGTAHEECVAELGFTGGAVGEIAERTVERLDAGSGAGVDHFRGGVMPKVLLVGGARCVGPRARRGVGKNFVIWMAAADTGRLHRPRRGEIGGTETD